MHVFLRPNDHFNELYHFQVYNAFLNISVINTEKQVTEDLNSKLFYATLQSNKADEIESTFI